TNTFAVPVTGAFREATTRSCRVATDATSKASSVGLWPPSGTPSAALCRIDCGESTENAAVDGRIVPTGLEPGSSRPSRVTWPQRQGSARTPAKVDQPTLT